MTNDINTVVLQLMYNVLRILYTIHYTVYILVYIIQYIQFIVRM